MADQEKDEPVRYHLIPEVDVRRSSNVSLIEDVDAEMEKLFDSSVKLEAMVIPHSSSVIPEEDSRSPRKTSFDLVDSINRHHVEEVDFDNHRRLSFPTMHHLIHPIRSTKSLKMRRPKPFSTEDSFHNSQKNQSDHMKRDVCVDVEEPSTSTNEQRKAGFYIGSVPSFATMEHMNMTQQPSIHSEEIKTESDRFRRNVSAAPELTQMFQEISDAPQASKSAAKPMISVPSRALVQGIRYAPEFDMSISVGSSSDDKATQIKTPSAKGKAGHRKRNEHLHLNVMTYPGNEAPTSNFEQFSLEEDEASNLKGVDIESMASHRLEDRRGVRRHKCAPRHVVHGATPTSRNANNDTTLRMRRQRQTSDANSITHQAFVQLDELQFGLENKMQWTEKARWIKFEEDVEEEAERWGRPHVASLSFHSLLELRKGLEQGSVLLDIVAHDLPSLMDAVVNNMILKSQVEVEQRDKVLNVLLLKHKHVTKSNMPRNISYHNLQNLLGKHRHHEGLYETSSFNPSSRRNSFRGSQATLTPEMTKPDVLEPTSTKHKNLSFPMMRIDNTTGESISVQTADGSPSPKPLPKQDDEVQHDSDILRRIPKNSEATAVLVGAVEFLKTPAVAFVRLNEGTLITNLTEVGLPIRFVFILLGPLNSDIDYHEIGRSISTLMSTEKFLDAAYRAPNRYDLLCAINTFLDESLVLPPGDWDKKTLLPILDMARKKTRQQKLLRKEKQLARQSVESKGTRKSVQMLRDPLKRTRRCFGGLIKDVKDRYPLYWSDIKDGLNMQCFAAMIFIYFAALSPAITFGGLMSETTDKWIGVSELIMSTAISGLVFALFSAQPLIIVGATGPIIVFEQSMYKFCQTNDWEFLPIRVWIGVWCCIIVTIVVAFELSFLIRYITRFTEEIFSVLISFIFIYQTFEKLVKIFKEHPLQSKYMTDVFVCNETLGNETFGNVTDNLRTLCQPPVDLLTNQPNTALLSTILMLGTFFIAYFLKDFRNSDFLGSKARRMLGDFGIPIAIVIMVLVDLFIDDAYTEKLVVPEGDITPTDPTKRGWVINPMGINKPLPIWMIFAAAIPAMLVFILIFMETQITGRLVNKKERRLRKGSGFHMDIMLCGWLSLVCGLLGLPIICAAPVRSILHVSALSIYSSNHAPGETPVLLKVHEQRLTGFFVSLMVGMSVLFGPLLKEIPIAVLFGVFLYMGLASLTGIHMWDRVLLMLKPVKVHPNVGYINRVRTLRMNMFTILQLLCLAMLWAVKSTAASLAFPFVLILLVPLRQFVLPHVFTEVELEELDQHDVEPVDSENGDDDDDKDFYRAMRS